MVKIAPNPTVLMHFKDNKVTWSAYSKENTYLQISTNITSDILDGIKISKQYEASTFFDKMPDEATCWVEVKYFNIYDYYLCIIKLDEME